MKSYPTAPFVFRCLAVALLLGLAVPAWAQSTAVQSAGGAGVRLVGVKGRVKVKRAGAATFVDAQAGMNLGVGDAISTGDFSEATLEMADKSQGRVDELTDLVVGPPAAGGAGYEVDVKGGGFYLLNREKATDQKFKTPVASGAILGTEFAVRVEKDGTTRVALFEGRVDLSNEAGSVSLAPGQESRVERGVKPTVSPLVDAVAPIQWTLYYPVVVDPAELGRPAGVPEAVLAAYRQGDLAAAMQAWPGQPTDEAGRVLGAALALAAGQADRARVLLDGAAGAPALALRRLIDVVQDRAGAEAVDPGNSASRLLAESYAAQRRLDLPKARELAARATEVSPQFGAAWIRVAELEFGAGRARPAAEALATGLGHSPRHAQGIALQGFVAAARGRLDEAERKFEEAIAIDPNLGTAWLGRGLCRIKRGDAATGRKHLQTAATLEPTRSINRSYLGKAFSGEGDLARARQELDRARELDPNDPTGWLYGALLAQQQNRLNEAVRQLEQSKALNDQRNLYRSRELLDQDRAVRGANLASVYRDAGLVDWGVREAGRAVQYDYANAAAHLFLANSYDTLRDPRKFNLRYETPWFSELLVANLLAPVGAGPLSQNISLQEYSRLLERDGFGFSSYTEYRSIGDILERGSQFGTFGGSSYAIDVDYLHQSGWVPNTDLDHLSLYGKFKQQVTRSDQLFVQVLYNNYENGDVAQYYDPNSASLNYRFEEKQEPNVFVGWNHEWAPGHNTLVLVGHLDDSVESSDLAARIPLVRRPRPDAPATALLLGNAPRYDVNYASDLGAWTAEAMHLSRLGDHTLMAGVRYQTGEVDSTASQVALPGQIAIGGRSVSNADDVSGDINRFSVYAYDVWQIVTSLHLTAGLAYEHVEFPLNPDLGPLAYQGRDEDQVSPKVGLLWSPLSNTHVRAAWTRSLGGVFYDTSVRLEPVQVAGFTQSYRSLVPESVTGVVPGTAFETFHAGVDQKFGKGTYVGVLAEWLRSQAEQSFGAFDYAAQGRAAVLPTTLSRRLPFDERSVQLNASQLFGDSWTLGAGYRVSEAELGIHYGGELDNLAVSPHENLKATLQRVDLFGQYAHPCGFFAQAVGRWNRQDNHGQSGLVDDDFWQVDLFAGYRFLRRRAEVRVGVLNVADQDYRLNPLNVHEEFPRERMFFSSLRLQF